MNARRLVLSSLLAALAVTSASPTARAAATIYVSPEGDDRWSGRTAQPNDGRTDGPVATLERARDILRSASRPAADQSRVVIADGQYTLTRPFSLTAQDSGVAYEAQPGAKPVFSGGKIIRGFEAGDDGIWRVRIPEAANGSWYFEQLFVNGHRATRARTPNKFYHYILDIHEETLQAGSGGRPARARQTVTAKPDDITPLFPLNEQELHDVQMVVYHNWDNTTRFITGVSQADSAILTTGEGMKSWNPWRKGDRFHLENFKAALDAPGEW
jgi:hypothetical protein